MAGLLTRSLLKMCVRLCVAARSPFVSFDFFLFGERDGPETNATQIGPWAFAAFTKVDHVAAEG